MWSEYVQSYVAGNGAASNTDDTDDAVQEPWRRSSLL